MEKEADLAQTVDMDTNERDLDALTAWLDEMIANLEQKCPDAPTYLVQAKPLKDLFFKVRIQSKEMNLNSSQSRLLIQFLTLVLWSLNLSICATIGGNIEKNPEKSLKFVDLAMHLFEYFILLRDSLFCLLVARFESFEDTYANIKVYSNIKSLIAFYSSYCLRFDDQIYNKTKESSEEWTKVREFLRILRNKSGHAYDTHSNKKENLKEFDDLLEVDYEGDPGLHQKIGNKVHKYALAIMVLFRFLLNDQDESFTDINQKWFSCDGKFFDQSGNVKKIEGAKSPKA